MIAALLRQRSWWPVGWSRHGGAEHEAETQKARARLRETPSRAHRRTGPMSSSRPAGLGQVSRSISSPACDGLA